MRILILGGDGYLGWPASMYFANKGHKVLTIDNLSKKKPTRKTKTFIIHPIHLKKLERSEKVETKKNKELDKNTKEKTK